MAYLKRSEALGANNRARQHSTKSAEQILRESASSFSENKKYDIFLSHAREDAAIILGVKVILEDIGHSVYVDWLEDTQLDRTSVSPTTAQMLRIRMSSCRSMLFATSTSSTESRWMPWELGYFDGLRNDQIAILPLLGDYDTKFRGQEYLGLYPVVEKDSAGRLRITNSSTQQLFLKEFVQGGHSYRNLY